MRGQKENRKEIEKRKPDKCNSRAGAGAGGGRGKRMTHAALARDWSLGVRTTTVRRASSILQPSGPSQVGGLKAGKVGVLIGLGSEQKVAHGG